MEVYEQQLIDFLNKMEYLSTEASDIYNSYFDTDASDVTVGVPSLLLNSDAATVQSKINKSQYLNGITLVNQVVNFFSNSAVAQGDYIDTVRELMYGNTARGSVLTIASEEIGNRLSSLATNLLGYFQNAQKILGMYNSDIVSSVAGALSDSDVMPGMSITKKNLVDFTVLTEQFKKLLNNEAVTTGDYQSTVDKKPSL